MTKKQLPPEVRDFFVRMGRQGGKLGGAARAANMTDAERSESARKAVQARWAKKEKQAEQQPTPPVGRLEFPWAPTSLRYSCTPSPPGLCASCGSAARFIHYVESLVNGRFCAGCCPACNPIR